MRRRDARFFRDHRGEVRSDLRGTFKNILKGNNEISHLSLNWQEVVNEVVSLNFRFDFGITVSDEKLSPEIRLGVEAFQAAWNETKGEK